MTEVRLNPRGVESAYLEGLRVCFPGAWDDVSYRWYHGRAFGGRCPDVLAAFVDSEPVAGMGVNYRVLCLADGTELPIGVLTAAWALPKHRGRMHFARLIRESKSVGRLRGCKALVAFVTADNASGLILQHAGAIALRTYYLHAGPGVALECPPRLPKIRDESPDLFAPPPLPGAVTFSYSRAEWREQFMRRPAPTRFTSIGSAHAVTEQAEQTDRLQWLSGPEHEAPLALAAAAHDASARGRSFFHFTTSAALARAAGALGLDVRDGALMVIDLCAAGKLAALPDHLHAPWAVQAGDRM